MANVNQDAGGASYSSSAAKKAQAQALEAAADAARAKAEAEAKAKAAAEAQKLAKQKAKAAATTSSSSSSSKTTTSSSSSKSSSSSSSSSNSSKSSGQSIGTTAVQSSPNTSAVSSLVGAAVGAALGIGANNGSILNNVNTNVTTGVNSNAAEVVDLLTQMLNAGIPGGGSYSYTPIPTISVSAPVLKTAAELAELYGLNYDLDYIYNTLMKSVDEGYKVRYQDQANAEDTYYDNAATAQNALINTLAQQQSQAILNGVNKGMQAANVLSSVLGTSQQFASNATQLAQARTQLAQEYAAQKAKTGADALATYNAMGADLAELAKAIYSSDVSRYVGELDYNTGVNTANAQMAAQQMAAQSAWQNTMANAITGIYDSYLKGQMSLEEMRMQVESAKYAADKQYEATVYNADKNLAGTIYNADKNYAGTTYSADKNYASNVYSANQNYAASKYAADQNYAANVYNTNATLEANKTAQQQSIVGGLIDNIISGIYTPEQGKQLLDVYKTNGMISQNLYNAALPYTTPSTSSSSSSSKSSSSSSSNNSTSKLPSSQELLDNILKQVITGAPPILVK